MKTTATLYSVGYATKPMGIFIQQLKLYGINVIADVRSVPYSKVFHDYHREALHHTLKTHGIAYVYLGNELGPRSKDPAHYNSEGQVQFDKLSASDLFQAGITRLFNGIDKGYTIACLCAEKDPAICHRSLLVGYAIKRSHELDMQHISHTGQCESQTELEKRLLSANQLVPDMLSSEADYLPIAYRQQCECYAYRRET